MFTAIHGKHLALVKILLEHKVNVEETDSKQMTPLAMAVCCSDAAIVKLLLDYGALVNTRMKDQTTAFSWGCGCKIRVIRKRL